MSERFKDGPSGDLARLLFEAADDDAPAPGAHGRALAALGVGSAVAASSSAAAAATAAAPKAATVVTGAAIAKWLALGAGAAFLTVGTGAVVARQVFAPEQSTTVVVTQGARPEAPPALPPRPAISELPSVTPKALAPAPPPEALAPSPPVEAIPLESLPRVNPAPLANTPPAAVRRGDAPSTSDLAMEVESLDRVRAALASANAGSALRELDVFSIRFPSAALAPEATVLRVQALLESGNRASAERLARRFIAASPGSPHSARIRLLIEGSARPKARFD